MLCNVKYKCIYDKTKLCSYKRICKQNNVWSLLIEIVFAYIQSSVPNFIVISFNGCSPFVGAFKLFNYLKWIKSFTRRQSYTPEYNHFVGMYLHTYVLSVINTLFRRKIIKRLKSSEITYVNAKVIIIYPRSLGNQLAIKTLL
jgi:hypothetical protein